MKINQIQNLFPNSVVARYNLAAWQKNNEDTIYFIGREVEKPGVDGEPDNGILKLFEVDESGTVLHEKTIWRPIYDGINLEDPRALEIDKEHLTIGLTAVLRNNRGMPIPFPSIVKINSLNTWNKELPPFLVIDTFGPGKNLTPVREHIYFFRPDSAEYNHKLLVFLLNAHVPEKLSHISFPHDLVWAKWRIGTTMPPIWINETEALFIIHGITIERIDGVDKYVYSLGRAKLSQKGNTYTVTVAPEPIITPDTFLNPDGTALVQELHPNLRRVVYSCGGVVKINSPKNLSLYVNVGDRTTFEVIFSLAELMKDLF